MIKWTCKPFAELSGYELYDIIRLRNEVFVVEQNCVFQDADNKDQPSYHLCGWKNETLIAYVRLVPPGISYEEPSIGRVVTSPSARRTGVGKLLMQKAIEECFKIFGKQNIRIGAQLYLKNFYESLSFRQVGDEYLEDNIPHVEMLYTWAK
jgi:ElaA protein